MNFAGGSIVLIGSALPPETAARHSDVSVAAAKWQMDFASALASDLDATVRYLSFVPLAKGEDSSDAGVKSGTVQVSPVFWNRGPGGFALYAASMIANLFSVRRKCRAVFCYNPSPWTAPWAMLLAMLSRAPMVMIVADIAPESGTVRQKMLAQIERVMLGSGQRFLLLSEGTRTLLPPRSLIEVFAGLPDEDALNAPLPTHTGPVKFVYTGSLADYGGVQVFLEAAAAMALRQECEFHVFGKGDLSHPVPDLVKDQVQVHGFVSNSELNEFLGANCVGVNPRIDPEGINRYNAPYKLLFYLSRGVPTITTLTPGVSPALGEACIVAAAGVEGLAAAMRSVVKMTLGERAELGRKGREIVQKQQSRTVLGKKVSALLA